jgi:acetylornithine deacetylase/succinyl-diaminopimelate desuccinylase-like protein
MRAALLLLVLACGAPAANPAAAAARAWREKNERAILAEYFGLLRLPNVASDTAGVRRNAEHIRGMLERRGVTARLLEVAGAPPAVFGSLPAPGAKATVVFYAHYDGQPTNPRDWTGSGPWEPSFRRNVPDAGPLDPELRIYARSSSDDKAPIQAMLAALDALREARLRPAVNLKFFFEGEEEAGSRNLGRILAAHRDTVAADAWIICDGPVHTTRRPQIVFGARGVTGLNLTVYGPRRELHSGHYGNWVPNPAQRLALLLASMKDESGRVLIKGFYDGVVPLSAAEQAALAQHPPVDEDLRRELWLGSTENAPKLLAEAINLPSLNVRGLRSAEVGDASRNVVPSQATASIDLRLVKGLDWRAQLERFIAHVRAQGYHVVQEEPDEATLRAHPKVARITNESGYNAVRTPLDLPWSRAVVEAVKSAHGDVLLTPTSGGSVPLSIIEDVVQVPLISVPIVNHDNSQHSANENLRLANLWQGIETFAALFTLAAP